MAEPEILKRGKDFHARVQADWEENSKGGRIKREKTIPLIPRPNSVRRRFGRMDVFVDESGDYVSIVEIKATDWDRIRPKNRRRLLAAHCRQVWRYIQKYTDQDRVDVCAGIIYPRVPRTPRLREDVEAFVNDYALQVVWYDS